jgi:alpha-glucoside transport system ATP-binding protein
MIYVTHDQVEAMTLASRIVVLADGGIAQVGPPLELYQKPRNEFVAQFIGSPAMNLLPGEIIETGERTRVRLVTGGEVWAAIPTRDADRGMKVNLGIRPEDLQLSDGPGLFEGRVAITEALGELTVLHIARGSEQPAFLAKLPGIHAGLRGESVRLTADPAKLHLFHDGRSLFSR